MSQRRAGGARGGEGPPGPTKPRPGRRRPQPPPEPPPEPPCPPRPGEGPPGNPRPPAAARGRAAGPGGASGGRGSRCHRGSGAGVGRRSPLHLLLLLLPLFPRPLPPVAISRRRLQGRSACPAAGPGVAAAPGEEERAGTTGHPGASPACPGTARLSPSTAAAPSAPRSVSPGAGAARSSRRGGSGGAGAAGGARAPCGSWRPGPGVALPLPALCGTARGWGAAGHRGAAGCSNGRRRETFYYFFIFIFQGS